MNYYRRYSGDYLRDTSRLSMLEHGAYSLLLDYYYSEEAPLPLEHEEIYTMVRAMKPADRAAVEKVLDKYFIREADGYHNRRADHEIEVSKTARTNGKNGGRPKTGYITGLETGCETEDETGLETETITEEWGGSVHPPTTNLQPPTNHPSTSKKNKRAQAPFVLPEWIPEEPWNAWIEARTKAKKPPTEWAKRLAVQKLDNLREQGHPPAQVLMDAAFNNWSGLFPPKEVR